MGVAARDLTLNRNRHSRRVEKPIDPRLTVIRFDCQDDSPLAVLVHYTARPILTALDLFKLSADYPGTLQAGVEQELKVPCVFIQGAAGNQSPNPPEGKRDPKCYGELLAEHALGLIRESAKAVSRQPSLEAMTERFRFVSRINFRSPITLFVYAQTFFPELIRNFLQEFENGVQPELTTVVLDKELAIVGLSGEPFCQHSLRLRQRANLPWMFVFGYCNGHQLHFPTIETAAEGGYGADARVSPIALGAGEMMMDCALISIFRMVGKFSHEPAAGN
jgi:hypothetical protein